MDKKHDRTFGASVKSEATELLFASEISFLEIYESK